MKNLNPLADIGEYASTICKDNAQLYEKIKNEQKRQKKEERARRKKAEAEAKKKLEQEAEQKKIKE